MKIVFFTFPYAGHIFPNIQLLSELENNGAELMIFGSMEYLCNVLFGENTVFEPYPEFINDFLRIQSNTENKSENPANHYYSYILNEDVIKMREYKVSQITRLFCELYLDKMKSYKPDYILVDSFAFFAWEIAAKLDVKCIELNCSVWEPEDLLKSKSWRDFVSNIIIQEVDNKPSIELINTIIRKTERLRKKLSHTYGFSQAEKKAYAYHCTALQDEPEMVSGNKTYLGYNLKHPENSIKKDGSIYVSRGTMSDAYGIKLLHMTLKAFEKIDRLVFASFGSNKKAQMTINDISNENIKTMLYCNQQEFLAKASVFVTHGGITGVREALLNRTPLLVIPANFPDYQVGKAIEKSHAGLLIENRPLNQEEILYKTHEIISHMDEYADGVNFIACKLQEQWDKAGIFRILDEIGLKKQWSINY
ncbi:MAG: hypothetical protein N2489_04540 [Clostridia bacterium]|nr:hypothetical protein [Clostridia bacterium]